MLAVFCAGSTGWEALVEGEPFAEETVVLTTPASWRDDSGPATVLFGAVAALSRSDKGGTQTHIEGQQRLHAPEIRDGKPARISAAIIRPQPRRSCLNPSGCFLD